MLKFMGLLPNSNALQNPAEDVASMIRLPYIRLGIQSLGIFSTYKQCYSHSYRR